MQGVHARSNQKRLDEQHQAPKDQYCPMGMPAVVSLIWNFGKVGKPKTNHYQYKEARKK